MKKPEQYYEKLYKIEGAHGKVFRYISMDKDDQLFDPFDLDDPRYWIEKEPKLVKSL